MSVLSDVARWWAEQQIRDRAERHYPGGKALARISAPHVLGPLVRRGVVSDIEVDVFGVPVGEIRLRRLEIHLHEVRVSRRELVRGRVRLDDLGSGRVEVEIDGPSLAAAVALPLTFHADEVEVRQAVGPLTVAARGALTVDGEVLRFRPGSVQGVPLLMAPSFEFRLPLSPLWPDAAEVRAVEGGLLVTCNLEDVPPGLTGPPGRETAPTW